MHLMSPFLIGDPQMHKKRNHGRRGKILRIHWVTTVSQSRASKSMQSCEHRPHDGPNFRNIACRALTSICACACIELPKTLAVYSLARFSVFEHSACDIA